LDGAGRKGKAKEAEVASQSGSAVLGVKKPF